MSATFWAHRRDHISAKINRCIIESENTGCMNGKPKVADPTLRIVTTGSKNMAHVPCTTRSPAPQAHQRTYNIVRARNRFQNQPAYGDIRGPRTNDAVQVTAQRAISSRTQCDACLHPRTQSSEDVNAKRRLPSWRPAGFRAGVERHGRHGDASPRTSAPRRVSSPSGVHPSIISREHTIRTSRLSRRDV